MASPKIIPYDVELRSVNPVRSFDRPKAYTNDLNSVEFQFKILDMTSTELSTATAVTLVYMRDGSFFANPSTDVSRVGNVFSYLLKENEGNHAGVAQIQLVVTVDGMELASPLFDFEIINGLETKVAQEVMIYDWTTLTRDAQDYIDQFVANEATRQQQFADAQTQRSTTFGESETGRATTFNASETGRTTVFNASEAGRTTAFNAAEGARATGYDADHSRAGTDHSTAVNDHTLAGTDHTTAVNDHTLAGTDHTRAEADHTRADADSATVGGYNTRLVDVETDTSFDATNMVSNGDMSNGTTNWYNVGNATFTAANNTLTITGGNTAASINVENRTGKIPYVGQKVYVRTKVRLTNGNGFNISIYTYNGATVQSVFNKPTKINEWVSASAVVTQADIGSTDLKIRTLASFPDASTALGKIIEIQYTFALDLTAIFGAGKEPTAAEMDRILSRFTNSWFDGTKNLFGAKTAIEKQIALDGGAVMDGENKITNGDFSNGMTGWGTYYASSAVSANIVTLTGTGAGTYMDLRKTLATVIGSKYYIRAVAKPIYSIAPTTIRIVLTELIGEVISAPVNNQSYTLRGIVTATSTAEIFRVIQLYTTVENQNTQKLEVSKPLVLDLTSIFGAGNEPTVEQMDAIMAKFENSWFDGTKNLFQAKASLNKLMALDARTEFETKNGVSNGNFSTGSMLPWSGYSGGSAFTNSGKVTLSPDATTMYVQPNQESSIPAKNGNKIYARTYIKSSVNATNENLMVHGGITQIMVQNAPPVINLAGGFISGILTLAGQVEQRLLKIYVSNTFATTALASTSQFEFGYVTLIDLTATFGAGKEPTLAEMDRLMARFPNSWFDGVKPIQTIETLYQEKANKTQEAWITPTLLNGWIAGAFGTPQYMLDELGFVHLRGSIKNGVVGQAAFTLPTGYRPSSIKAWISTSGYEAFNTGFITTSGSFAANKLNTNGDTALDNISFKVGA
jgi:hypothetical protein